MNPTEVSQGLFSLLPSFSTLQAPLQDGLQEQGNGFAALLTDLMPASDAEQSALLESLPEDTLLPPDGQPLPLLPQMNGKTEMQPHALLARIRQAQGFADQGLAATSVTSTADSAELLAVDKDPMAEPVNPDEVTLLSASLAVSPSDSAQRAAGAVVHTTADGKPVGPQVVNNDAEHRMANGVRTESSALTDVAELTDVEEGEMVGIEAEADDRPGVTQIRQDNTTPAQRLTVAADVVADSKPTIAPADVAVTGNSTVTQVVTADELSLTEAEVEQLEEQEQLAQTRERLEFGRDKEKWAPALGSRIVTMVADNIQQAEIHLDPPELGSLEIKLQVSQEQTTIQVQAQSPQVRDVLEANAQRLRDALAEQGLELAGFDVSQQQSQSGEGDGSQSGGSSPDGEQVAHDALAEETATQASAHDGLLDTFA